MPDRATLGAFLAFVLVGGVNFVAVGFSNRELPPNLGAGLRFTLAAALLFGLVVARRLSIPTGPSLRAASLYGVLSFTVAYALAYYALTTLSAGAGAVVFASTPLFTAILAPLHRIERFRVRVLIGSIITLVGIVILADPFGTDRLPLLPLLAMTGSAMAAAEAGVVLKMAPPANPVATNAVAMSIGGCLLLLISGLAGERWQMPQRSVTWFAVVYLAVLGSAALFGLFLFVLHRWSATSTSYMAALLPVSAMIAGAVLADQPITVNGLIGGGITLAGVYVGALSGQPTEVPSRAAKIPFWRDRSTPGEQNDAPEQKGGVR